MSDAQEAKDLLSNKPDSDISWGGSASYRSVNMVIVKYGPSSTKRDLRKLRRKISSSWRDSCHITVFRKDKKRVFIFEASNLDIGVSQLIQNYYDWVIK
jgi:hypothetical protein